MYPDGPSSDFDGFIDDMLRQSSELTHGYTSQINTKRDQLDEMDNYAETSYGQVGGGSILGALGALLAGGNPGQIAGGAYSGGASAYNNLAAEEKRKTASLEKDIAFQESLLKDEQNFGQALQTSKVTVAGQLTQQNMLGNLIGTPLREQGIREDLALHNDKEMASADATLYKERAQKEEGLGVYGRPGYGPATPEEIAAAKNIVKGMGGTDSDMAFFDSSTSRELNDKVDSYRRAMAEKNKLTGGYPGKIGPQIMETVAKAETAERTLQRSTSVLQGYLSEMPQNPTARITLQEIMKRIPGTEGKKLAEELNFISTQLAVGTLGRQGLSDMDRQVFQDFISGSGAIAGELFPRMQRAQKAIRDEAALALGGELANPGMERAVGARASAFLSNLPEGEREAYSGMIYNRPTFSGTGAPSSTGGPKSSEEIQRRKEEIYRLNPRLRPR